MFVFCFLCVGKIIISEIACSCLLKSEDHSKNNENYLKRSQTRVSRKLWTKFPLQVYTSTYLFEKQVRHPKNYVHVVQLLWVYLACLEPVNDCNLFELNVLQSFDLTNATKNNNVKNKWHRTDQNLQVDHILDPRYLKGQTWNPRSIQ